jgi:hypothetical protein
MNNVQYLIILFCFLLTNCQNENSKSNFEIKKTDTVQQSDSLFYLKFNLKAKQLKEGGFELLNKELRAEFILKGKFPSKYSIEIKNDSISVLSKYENNKWEYIDTIRHMFQIIDSNEILLPSYKIVDFENDGNQDLVCWVNTNVNGNVWSIIYLNNPEKKSLDILRNTAGRDEKIWDSPEYNIKDSTINCTLVSGVYGLSFESKYKIENHKAIPIEKQETDNTHLKNDGSGGIDRLYIGKNGKWKLVKEIKN